MMQRNKPYTDDYIVHLETEIQKNVKEKAELVGALEKKINISDIKKDQQRFLKAYRDDWNHSWRSWRLFRDGTRKEQMNNFKNYIDTLRPSDLIGYLEYLEETIAYANSKNATHYVPTLNKMRNNLMSHFDQKSKQLLGDILHKEVEIKRLISKQRGHEEFPHDLSNLSRYIKK